MQEVLGEAELGLGGGRNELQKPDTLEANGSPCPPLSRRHAGRRLLLPFPGPYFSQPRFGMEQLGCLEPSWPERTGGEDHHERQKPSSSLSCASLTII